MRPAAEIMDEMELNPKDGQRASTAEEIMAPFADMKATMAALMKAMNIPVLVFQGYTPSWNDGDPCNHRTEYFDVPGLCTDDGVCMRVAPDGTLIVDDGSTEEEEPPSIEYPKGTWLFFEFFFKNVLGTNKKGTITLQEDGTLKILSKKHTVDY